MLIFFQSRASNIDEAFVISENYLNSLDRSDLVIGEIMEFEQNFYITFSRAQGRFFSKINHNCMLIRQKKSALT